MKYLILFLIVMVLLIIVIRTLFKGSASHSKPSIYYMLLSADRVFKVHTEGYSDILHQMSPDQDTQYAIFSITKTFTATAILQLQEEGKLSIDDPAADYLPHYDFLQGVSIRHLLSHQSGLNNPLPLSWIHLASEDASFNYPKFSRQTLIKHAKQKSKPGSKAAYSNLNYLLLGEIIEVVSGKSYQSYITEHVLNNPGIGFQWNDVNTAKGYHKAGLSSLLLGLVLDKKKFTSQKEGKYLPFRKSYLNGSAYGGLHASARGLQQYLQEFLKPESRIFSSENKQLMFTQQLLSNGKPSGHSLGWHTGELEDKEYVCHAGGGGGFYAEMRIYPSLGLASFILTNESGFSDKRVLDEFDASYIKEKINDSKLPKLQVNLSKKSK